MRNAQEIYETAIAQLRFQKQKSHVMDGPEHYICLYHSPDGYKCPIGAILPDTEYKPEMERLDVNGLIGSGLLTIERKVEFQEHRHLLKALMSIHDNKTIETWEKQFRMLADDLKLIYPKEKKS